MSFLAFKKLAPIVAIACSLCPLIPATGQTGIPLGVELSGYAAIPSNSFGSLICGRLWLDGTNLSYRFAAAELHLSFAGSTVELKGPASPETNGPLLYVLNPFSGSVAADSACDAAAGITIILGPQDPPRPPGPRIAQGTISIASEEIPQVLGGQWYANARGRRPLRVGPDQSFEFRGQILPLDTDADGVPDYLDHCADTPPDSLINSQGCSVEQLCPCDGPWNNHGDYVNSLKQVLEEFVQEGLLDRGQSRLLLQSGVQSDCGKRDVAKPHPK